MNNNISARSGSLPAVRLSSPKSGRPGAFGGKKILYIITQSEFGGAQRYCFDLANNLKNEFEVCLAAGGQDELAERLENADIKYFQIPHLKRAVSPINDLLAIIEIIKLIKKEKPDIIHLNSSKISILGSLATKICYMLNVKCYVVYTAHGWVFNEPMPSWQKIFYKYAEKFTSIIKNKIICVSEFDLQTAIKEKITSKEKLITIHNGFKPLDLLPAQEARNILNKFFIDNSRVLIGAIGNLYKTKGYEYLIEAGNILINKMKLPVNIVIIGKGEEKRNLLNLIEKYKLEKNIVLAGGIRNASKLLSGFDVYALSSVKEGFPYSVLEAMAAKLPIVATQVGGVGEMIIDKNNGLTVPPANPQKLAETIEKIIANNKFAECLAIQAQRDALEKFNIEKMIEKTKKVYLE